MSNSTASLTRQTNSAGDLRSVVRTLKALAASSIGQYEKSVQALGERTIASPHDRELLENRLARVLAAIEHKPLTKD